MQKGLLYLWLIKLCIACISCTSYLWSAAVGGGQTSGSRAGGGPHTSGSRVGSSNDEVRSDVPEERRRKGSEPLKTLLSLRLTIHASFNSLKHFRHKVQLLATQLGLIFMKCEWHGITSLFITFIQLVSTFLSQFISSTLLLLAYGYLPLSTMPTIWSSNSLEQKGVWWIFNHLGGRMVTSWHTQVVSEYCTASDPVPFTFW